ncbi:hypothetical protein GJAV_G00053130 [Gymnothorax javanicus]|nr:hypothetical protein GJAV_G00053130 [Gymnothorax javanicus]
MAPLLGRKPFSLVEPLAETPGPGEEVFIIEHTKEAFRNKEEYEARQQMYSAKIWTCKSTGSSQLTHKEAWDEEQEVTELLQEEYPAWFEKPVLEMVHHNTISLEKLVDQTWVEILTKYAVGEECDFWVGERSWRARVLKVHPLESPEEEVVKKLEGACDSPSSDKENATQEVQKEEPQPIEEENRRDSRCDRARRSPRTLPTSQKEQKKKCGIPKFLPHKYDILLLEENKIVNDIPADSLYRTERPPNKEILRYFIRHYALRLGTGDNAPWVVEDDLVKKYSLPSKLSDFVLEQYKNAGTLKRPPAGMGDARPTKMSRKSEGKKAERRARGAEMQQVFLLNTPREGGAASPVGTKKARSSGPGTPKPGETLPHIAKRLMRSYEKYKDNEDQKSTFSTLVTKASKVLSAEDRSKLPEELQQLVQQRWEQLEHKRNLAALSEGEKREVAARKRMELNEKRREKWRLARHEHQRRVEDQELEGRCLPDFKLVDMPEGLPNALFGDIAMVTDFFNSYSSLLMPNDQNPIAVTALMEALASEGAGFLYLNRVFVILLQTLLQDELAEGYSELGMALSEIPVSLHSVSELVRLSLRPSDVQVEESSRASEEWAEGGCDDVVSASLLEKLETVELFELTPSEKVTLLVALCYRILMTYSVEDQLNSIHERIAQIWKDRADTVKATHHRKMAEKRRQQELLGARGMSGCWVELGSRIEISQFIRRMKEGSAKKANEEPVPGKADSEDVIRAAKSRSLMSVPAQQNRARSEMEAEDKWDRKEKASAEKIIQDGIDKLKLIMRRLPLGTDRFHNRYWLFSDQVPGLYIEKGWAHESIDYHYTLPSDEEDEEEEEEESVKDAEVEEVQCGLEGAPAEAGHQRAQLALENIETSVPKVGQNLWCVCDTTQQLEELIECLHPQGVRECGLKTRLRLRYQDIVDSIRLVQKPTQQLNTCDVHQELLRFLRSDIMEMASRLQKGGLGQIDDLTELEERVHSLEKLKDLGECVIDLQARSQRSTCRVSWHRSRRKGGVEGRRAPSRRR